MTIKLRIFDSQLKDNCFECICFLCSDTTLFRNAGVTVGGGVPDQDRMARSLWTNRPNFNGLQRERYDSRAFGAREEEDEEGSVTERGALPGPPASVCGPRPGVVNSAWCISSVFIRRLLKVAFGLRRFLRGP